jgi:hypothetical protein
MGAVDVSREGGFRQRSVLGRAARAKEPMKSGTASSGRLRAVKEALDGGMAGRAVAESSARRGVKEVGAEERAANEGLRQLVRRERSFVV